MDNFRYENLAVFAKQDEHWNEWRNNIPTLNFPSSWNVRIWPPFAGALIRFQVNNKISVYPDVADNLGYVGQPYWELYPNAEGDCSRHLMEETEELLREIDSLL